MRMRQNGDKVGIQGLADHACRGPPQAPPPRIVNILPGRLRILGHEQGPLHSLGADEIQSVSDVLDIMLCAMLYLAAEALRRLSLYFAV